MAVKRGVLIYNAAPGKVSVCEEQNLIIRALYNVHVHGSLYENRGSETAVGEMTKYASLLERAARRGP